MPPKRPHDQADASGSGSGSGGKRSRLADLVADDGPSASRSPSSSTSIPSSSSVQAQIAAAKARIEAQVAVSQLGLGNAASRQPTATSPAATSQALPSRPTSTAPAQKIGGFDPSAIAKQVAEAKKRAMAAVGGMKTSTSLPTTQRDSKSNSGIHPLLASRGTIPKPSIPSEDSKPSIGTSTPQPEISKRSYPHQFDKAPKFSSVSINNRSTTQRNDGKYNPNTSISIQANPYLSTALELSQDPENFNSKSRSTHRGFQFNRPGKHIKEAEETRRDARMEDLKRRIEESARKAGLAEEVGGENGVVMRSLPPEIEWWDLGLVEEGVTYEKLDFHTNMPKSDIKGKGKAKEIEGVKLQEGAIDNLIQHPIPLPPPASMAPTVAPRGLMLTKQEAKKLRRQRRAADLEDKRDRIKMGELPPDAPKVKLSNIVRVLASESVADPTKVEARVRREIAARAEAHERSNAENKLTKEQKDAKRDLAKQKEEKKGTSTAVFKINHLISPSHKFKVRKNAQQNDLTGVTIFHPSFALVVVEGSFKSLKNYKHLMMNRIDWTDPGQPKQKDEDDEDENFGHKRNVEEDVVDLDGVDWEGNKCQLIFEGQIRERCFKGFKAHKCPTDKTAKEALVGNVNQSSSSTSGGMGGYWDVAKRWDTSVGDD